MVSIEAQPAPLPYQPRGWEEYVFDPMFHVPTQSVIAEGGEDFYLLGRDGQWWPIVPDILVQARVLYRVPYNYDMAIGPLIWMG